MVNISKKDHSAVNTIHPAPRLLRPSSKPGQRGFTLVEAMITVLVLGLVAAAVVPMLSSVSTRMGSAKLEADVNALNLAVGLYIADGGSLAGLTTPQAVIDRLKRIRPVAEQKTHTGVTTGRLVDVRLSTRMGSGAMKLGQSKRVIWNSNPPAGPGGRAQHPRFELTTAATNGVDEFYLDDSLSAASFPLDTRTRANLKFNSANGWVWGDTGNEPTVAQVIPTNATTAATDNAFRPGTLLGSGSGTGGTGTGSGSATGGGSGTGTGVMIIPLPTPALNPGSGTFSYSSFPGSLAIDSNGADPGVSRLVYRVNGGAWTPYSGPLSISPASVVEAKNEATSSLASDSSTVSGSFYRLVAGFTGNGTGNWLTPSGGSTLVYSLDNQPGQATLTHGSTELDDGMGGTINSGVENVLVFRPQSFNTIAPDTSFAVGNLTLLNGTTFNDSEAGGATLSLNLSFSDPAVNQVVDVNFSFINTDNSPDRLSSADIVQINNPSISTGITVEGVNYKIQLEWVTLDPGAGVVQGSQFLVFEGASARAELRAKLVANQ